MTRDALYLTSRTGLPDDMRVGLADYPRDRWGDPTLAETARFWLSMHDGFRRHHGHKGSLIAHWRGGHSDLVGLHNRLIPTVQQFLQHLHGHHTVETQSYFPAFRTLDPRIAHGIDLLDRDHDVVHGQLDDLHAIALAFHRVLSSGAADAGEHANRLADVIEVMGPTLLRHLEDEEEIVIPLIALKGADLT